MVFAKAMGIGVSGSVRRPRRRAWWNCRFGFVVAEQSVSHRHKAGGDPRQSFWLCGSRTVSFHRHQAGGDPRQSFWLRVSRTVSFHRHQAGGVTSILAPPALRRWDPDYPATALLTRTFSILAPPASRRWDPDYPATALLTRTFPVLAPPALRRWDHHFSSYHSHDPKN
jgi:hypothetical protein